MQITTRQFPVLVAAILILASLTTGVSAQSAVWVVDARSGAGSHTKSLTEAVRFSRNGDVILVRPGTYKSIKLLDKALTILRDGPVGSVVVGNTVDSITIEKAPTGENVTIRGIKIRGRLVIRRCRGSVAVEDCQSMFCDIADSTSVTISRCRIVEFYGPSVTAIRSGLFAYDSSFHAGRGGHGIVANFSRVSASGCDIRAGDGVAGGVLHGFCYNAAVGGGDGVRMFHSTVSIYGGSLHAGKPAAANPPCAGAPGGAIVTRVGGVWTRTLAAPRSFATNSPVREGQRLELDVSGQNGDHAWLLVNSHHDPVQVPGCDGAMFPALARVGLYYMGQVRNGRLKWNVTVRPLPVAAYGGRLAAQALILPATGCVFSTPSNIILLDRRF
jgi:hypothetical protein